MVNGNGNGHPVTPEELIAQLRESVERLPESGLGRADLKMLSKSFRELVHAFRRFEAMRDLRKVTVFGSARCKPGSPAYAQAEAFGREMAKRGWMVVTGGGPGIMEAAHVGAGRDLSLGINILLPFEQHDNKVLEGGVNTIHTKYFFTRKLLFVKESQGVALFPGGFGTLDEAFEVLTLLQTGKSHPFPVVLVDEPGGWYWRAFEQFVERDLKSEGWVSRDDTAVFRITDRVEEAVEEIESFYRVYHSMRYVGPDLVIRLKSDPGAAFVEGLDILFADILEEGVFRLSDPLPEESNEPELADLPRLVFRFNRRDFGRLRLLIDALNAPR
ncbi:MAG TPA: TIGR00730 family Rossman fold protein [Candidatus Deferrimicrobiaceae bacterium]